LFKEDFLAEMEAKRRIADENQHLSNKVENLQRELSQLVLTRELGIPVNDELIKQQAARWSSLKASESDSTTLVPRCADNGGLVECNGLD
jgi:hypothetical protein